MCAGDVFYSGTIRVIFIDFVCLHGSIFADYPSHYEIFYV